MPTPTMTYVVHRVNAAWHLRTQPLGRDGPPFIIKNGIETILTDDLEQKDMFWQSTKPSIICKHETVSPCAIMLAGSHARGEATLTYALRVERLLRNIDVPEELQAIVSLPAQQVSLHRWKDDWGCYDHQGIHLNTEQFAPDGLYAAGIKEPAHQLAMTVLHEIRHGVEKQTKSMRSNVSRRRLPDLHVAELVAYKIREEAATVYNSAMRLGGELMRYMPTRLSQKVLTINPATLEICSVK